MKKASQKGEKQEKYKKYQYTKPYKDRDRSKDFGKDLPLKKSGRLKFPQKPQYYTLYTVPKLASNHPFFNIRNKDIQDVRRNLQQAKKDLQKLKFIQSSSKNQNQSKKSKQTSAKDVSCELRSSAFYSNHSENKSALGADCESNRSSLGIVTITSFSNKSKSNPFSKGFTVTSGPKIYAKHSDNCQSGKPSLSANTPKASVLSGKELKNDILSEMNLSGVTQWVENASV